MATLVTAPTHSLHSVGGLKMWHLLSLDAPTVAALWTLYLPWQFSVHSPAVAPVALAAAVWMLYVLDRILDAQRDGGGEVRHRLHLRYRTRFLAGCVAVAACLLILLLHLPHALRTFWLLLAIPLALYVCAVHVVPLRKVPKELVVASFFAVATAGPVVASSRVGIGAVWPVMLCFGMLCWLNCSAIARWERSLHEADAATIWLGENLNRGAFLLALLSVPILLSRHTAPIAVAVMAAAACLLMIDQKRERFDAVTLRALADAALLTPLVTWPLAGWLHLR